MFKLKVAHTPEEAERIIALRYKVLRQPWNKGAETATDNLEPISINVYIENEKKEVVACGRLQENENKIGQIRFMAVDDQQQGKGLGKMIVSALESEAKKLDLHSIELHARENAVEFYKSCGYAVKEKTFLLWGIIQHYLMEKKL